VFSMGKSESFKQAGHLDEMSFPPAWAGGNHSMRPGAFCCTGYHRTFSNMAMCATRPIDARASLSQNPARYLSQEFGDHLVPKRRQALSQIITTCYNESMVEWARFVWQNKWNRVRTDKYTSMDIDLKILVSLAGSLSKGMLEVSEISGDGAKNTHFNLRLPSAEKHFCRRGSLLASFGRSLSAIPKETTDLSSGIPTGLYAKNRVLELVKKRDSVHQQHQVCEQAFAGLGSTNASTKNLCECCELQEKSCEG